VAQPESRGVHAVFPRAGGEVGRERERAEDRRDPEPRDQLEQPARLAGADRHDGGAARLQRHVVGDAAGIERVVEAVGHHVGGQDARDPERLPAHRAVRLVVGLGEADGDRLARRPGRHVHAHEPLGRCAPMRPEGRLAALPLAQLLLGRERQARQVARAADLAADAAQPLGVEGARGLEVRQLALERDH
jgi:hypothetical protein